MRKNFLKGERLKFGTDEDDLYSKNFFGMLIWKKAITKGYKNSILESVNMGLVGMF